MSVVVTGAVSFPLSLECVFHNWGVSAPPGLAFAVESGNHPRFRLHQVLGLPVQPVLTMVMPIVMGVEQGQESPRDLNNPWEVAAGNCRGSLVAQPTLSLEICSGHHQDVEA